MKSKRTGGFFPCPYCHGRGVLYQGQQDGDPTEYCGACGGGGDGRQYILRRDMSDNVHQHLMVGKDVDCWLDRGAMAQELE